MMPNKYSSKTLSLFTWHQVFFVLLMLLLPSKAIRGQDLTINATFAGNITAAQQAVIQQAINEWHAIITSRGINPASFPVTFQNGPLNGGTAAVSNPNVSQTTGAMISSVITFDNDGSTTWFIDPTPANPLDDAIPAVSLDYLTVARHEIGHALGITSSANSANQGFVSGNTFDASRLNIGVTNAGNHTTIAAHPGDLMNTNAGGPGLHTPISLFPAASLIARGYQCDIIMHFVDGANTGTESGSATDPWNTVTEGLTLTPVGRSLLLIPGIASPQSFNGNYTVPVPLSHNTSITISSARGGSAVVSEP